MTLLRILDPTVGPDRAESALAPRVPALDGKVLGLLANGKVNADRLLQMVREGIESRYRLRDVVTLTKASATRVAGPEVLEALGRQCDAVVTAVGD